MNYNLYLENAVRSDVIGRNIYTMGCRRIWDYKHEVGVKPGDYWDAPALGMPGIIAIGHQIDVTDVLTITVRMNGKEQQLEPVRNRWTPAWMETYYRSSVETDYYPKSGTLCIKETKGFLPGDTFLAELVISNDRREPVEVSLSMNIPFPQSGKDIYLVSAKTQPGSLGKQYPVTGYAAAVMEPEGTCLHIPANGNVTVRYGFAFDPLSADEARERAALALKTDAPFRICEKNFNDWMERNVPKLTTENPDFLKIYYYRYFVIYRGIHTPGDLIPGHDFQEQCVYESPFGYWFGAPVGLSVPLQVEEMKWMKDISPAVSQLRNWKREAGNTRGYIQATPMGLWHLYTLRGDESLLEEMYDACRGYTLWKCDPEDPGKLPVQTGSWGTGAEYQPSFYQFTEPKYDWRHDNEMSWQGYPHTKLHRLDECVLHAANLMACARMAQRLGKDEDGKMLEEQAEKTLERICQLCWNEEKGFFFDCDPETLAQCDESRCYDGFFPMLWGLLDGTYDEAFGALEQENLFGADFPVASVDKESPMYWYDNCITGPAAASEAEPHYYECCWNGPTWPFATSFVLEALGGAAERSEKWVPLWNRLFERYTQLHFACGDRSLPRIAEHYRSTDGVSFSPYHEYFHSTWIDLFMHYWAGIRVEEGEVVFQPMTDEDFTLEDVVIRGRRCRFSQRTVNGQRIREMKWEDAE